jgi:3-phosphoshikimate 1-carboxyvinyltransferase
MNSYLKINKIIKPFNKKINVDGDKSLSIRFAIMASQAKGKSKAFNLLKSKDVLSTLKCLKKLGVKISNKKNYCEIVGKGLNSYDYRNNLTLDAGNSGTAARLLATAGLNSPTFIRITGDASLKKRDMKRIILPLKKFGAQFKNNKGTLPLYIKGSDLLKPINFIEHLGSAQVKSVILISALLSSSKTTTLKCKPSRTHTEILFKYLKIPIKIKNSKKFDYIKIKGKKNFKGFNYKIPGDISSASFPIVLTLLAKNSKLVIKGVNINSSRTGVIKILNKMGANIKFYNKKIYKGEPIADISIKSINNLKAIKLSKSFNNSTAIDEFNLIFLCAAFSKGISSFRGLLELQSKESKRLDWGFKILNMIGIKTKKIGNHGIKIWGNPDLKLNKNYVIKDYLKDHRIAMCSTVLALAKGGSWKIYDANESIKTSFPSFQKIIKDLGGRIS